jgi:transcriptional regulator with XRE-family HTH domain
VLSEVSIGTVGIKVHSPVTECRTLAFSIRRSWEASIPNSLASKRTLPHRNPTNPVFLPCQTLFTYAFPACKSLLIASFCLLPYDRPRSRVTQKKGGQTLELHTQIKKYRSNLNLSQEELAEKVYVTRQTISNWENNKNYPDIHSLLLLSSIFHISLDQLVKGDIDIMRQEISEAELKNFNRNGAIFTSLLVLFIVSVVPLTVFLGYYGLIISAVLFAVTMYFAFKIEKYKKVNDIQTFKEIIAFTEGKRLDEIERNQEYGKRPYQKILAALTCAVITFFVSMLFIWLLKSFIF